MASRRGFQQNDSNWKSLTSWKRKYEENEDWRWRQHGPPKHWYPVTALHGVTAQKTTSNFITVSRTFIDHALFYQWFIKDVTMKGVHYEENERWASTKKSYDLIYWNKVYMKSGSNISSLYYLWREAFLNMMECKCYVTDKKWIWMINQQRMGRKQWDSMHRDLFQNSWKGVCAMDPATVLQSTQWVCQRLNLRSCH
jgi:hypothetical protein